MSLSNTHEEADTKMMLHAIAATKYGAIQLEILSPDTDVLVLALSKYHLLTLNNLYYRNASKEVECVYKPYIASWEN